MNIEDGLRDLSKLSADDLALRLADHFAAVGGLACAGKVEIAAAAPPAFPSRVGKKTRDKTGVSRRYPVESPAWRSQS